MSNARFFDIKMYFAEKVTAVLMSMLFADFARKTHFFSREEHAVRGIPRTADTVENGMSHTVASRELVYQVPLRISSFADSLFRGTTPNTPIMKGMFL